MFYVVQFKVCHFWVSDMGGGVSGQKVTKCDKGGGRGGVKKSDFGSDVLFASPLIKI